MAVRCFCIFRRFGGEGIAFGDCLMQDYTDLDDFPDFFLLILEDVKKILGDISG